ncbi:MAG: hypothetical protein JXQ96_11685 [Cyclobacteriaceae bacterium]
MKRRNLKFESTLFRALLLVSIPYWFFSLIFESIVTNTFDAVTILDIINLNSTAIILVFHFRNYKTRHLTIIYALISLVCYFVYWKYLGAITGPMTYCYFSLLVILVALLRPTLRLYFVGLLCIINIILTIDYDSQVILEIIPLAAHLNDLLTIEFFLNTYFITFAMVYFKWNFDKEGEAVNLGNEKLNQLNSELFQKQEQLKEQKIEIQEINQNLEKLVAQHTVELEQKTNKLRELAYHNSHIIRKPLTNMLGIVNLLKRNRTDFSELEILQNDCLKLDSLTREINTILK